MNLKRSIDSLAKRLDRFDPGIISSNKTSLSHWKGRPIIPFEEWIKIRNTPYALKYFPDDFDEVLTYIPEDEVEMRQEEVKKWNSDYLELMGYTKNSNYGRLRCFHCLLSPDGDDPIFIGINRLVAKGLIDREQGERIQYPCQVVNRFQCPYEMTSRIKDNFLGAMYFTFDVDDLFRLQRMAFAVEISLAKARKEDSRIRIKNKEELLHTLTDKETFAEILEPGSEAPEVSEDIRTYLADNHGYIVDYFMKIKDKVNMEELRFY